MKVSRLTFSFWISTCPTVLVASLIAAAVAASIAKHKTAADSDSAAVFCRSLGEVHSSLENTIDYCFSSEKQESYWTGFHLLMKAYQAKPDSCGHFPLLSARSHDILNQGFNMSVNRPFQATSSQSLFAYCIIFSRNPQPVRVSEISFKKSYIFDFGLFTEIYIYWYP